MIKKDVNTDLENIRDLIELEEKIFSDIEKFRNLQKNTLLSLEKKYDKIIISKVTKKVILRLSQNKLNGKNLKALYRHSSGLIE